MSAEPLEDLVYMERATRPFFQERITSQWPWITCALLLFLSFLSLRSLFVHGDRLSLLGRHEGHKHLHEKENFADSAIRKSVTWPVVSIPPSYAPHYSRDFFFLPAALWCAPTVSFSEECSSRENAIRYHCFLTSFITSTLSCVKRVPDNEPLDTLQSLIA